MSVIHFTKHAKEKFEILERHKFKVTKIQVIQTINEPNSIDYSRSPLLIAQRRIDSVHVLRVVYKKGDGNKIIITFYPGRVKQYEEKNSKN